MKILMLLSRFPYPLEKGDKLRAFHQIQAIAKEHHIFLYCINSKAPSPEQLSALEPYCERIECFVPSKAHLLGNIFLSLFEKKPWQYAFFVFGKARRRIEDIVEEWAPDHLFCQLLRTADYAKKIELPKTLDFQDAFSLALQRRADRSAFPINRFLQMESQRMRRAEKEALQNFTHCLIISEKDKKALPNPLHLPVHVIKNGIDTLYFCKDDQSKPRFHLLFVGNLAYPPNVEAARFLIQEIIPRLRSQFPDIRLCLAGANPGKRLRKAESPHVHILANPPEIKEAYSSADIFVAPLFSGAGLQNKVLEALAMEIPCITTSIGNAGIQATHGKEILIANTADEILQQITSLLKNETESSAMKSNGRRFVHENFSWPLETEKWLNLLSPSPTCTKK